MEIVTWGRRKGGGRRGKKRGRNWRCRRRRKEEGEGEACILARVPSSYFSPLLSAVRGKRGVSLLSQA